MRAIILVCGNNNCNHETQYALQYLQIEHRIVNHVRIVEEMLHE